MREQSVGAVLMSLYRIEPKHRTPLQDVCTDIDDFRYSKAKEVQLASPNWASQISYEAIASLQQTQVVRVVLICFYGIIAKCFETVKNPNCCSDDNEYEMMLACGAASSQQGKIWTSSRVEQFCSAVLICF